MTPPFPSPRGETSAALFSALHAPPHHLPPIALPSGADPLADAYAPSADYALAGAGNQASR